MQLLREILKPFFRWMTDRDYREYLYVRRKCRRGGRMTLRIQGFTLEVIDSHSFLHLYEEMKIRGLFDARFESSTPIIVSAGSNAGIELFLIAQKYPAARIIAYEADEDYASVLKRNVERNELKNIEVIHAAAWTSNGMIPFYRDGKLGGKVAPGGSDVRSLHFRKELEQLRKIDLLLMDIEGAENVVVPDCVGVLDRVDALFIEWHGRINEEQSLPELLDLLSQAGFRYQLDNNITVSPFKERLIENGFDSMAGIFATRPARK